MVRRTSTLASAKNAREFILATKFAYMPETYRTLSKLRLLSTRHVHFTNTMMSEMRMQNDTRSRAPISDKQLIGVTRISMLLDKNHMTCIFAPTFTIPTPARNIAYSDYKTDTRIPTHEQLELVRTDVSSPFNSKAIGGGGSQFNLVIVDDFSRKSWTVPLRNKSDTKVVMARYEESAFT